MPAAAVREPGPQVYTGNFLGIALETQHFPDSPNHPHFPSTILELGREWTSSTVYRLGMKKK
jgi:aldose 1-epimerase